MASNSCKPNEATNKRMPSPRTSTPENSKRKRGDEVDLSLNPSRRRGMDARDLKQLDTRLSQLVDQFQASCKAMVKEVSGKREEWLNYNELVEKFGGQQEGITKAHYEIKEKMRTLTVENKKLSTEKEEIKKKYGALKTELAVLQDTCELLRREIEDLKKNNHPACSVRVAEPDADEVENEVDVALNKAYKKHGIDQFYKPITSDVSDMENTIDDENSRA